MMIVPDVHFLEPSEVLYVTCVRPETVAVKVTEMTRGVSGTPSPVIEF